MMDVRDYPAYADDSYWSRHAPVVAPEHHAWSHEVTLPQGAPTLERPLFGMESYWAPEHPPVLAPLVKPRNYLPRTQAQTDLKKAGLICLAIVVVPSVLIVLATLYMTIKWY